MERIALVGNGINDAQKITWNGLLTYVQTKLEIENAEKIEFNQNTSPIIAFDSLCKLRKEIAEENVRKLIKEYIEDKSNFVNNLNFEL